MKRRQIWTSSVAVVGLTLLISFQNCAPSAQGVTGSGSTDVRIVDRWQSEKLSFPVQTYFVEPSVDSVNIDGVCNEQKGIREVVWRAVLKSMAGHEQVLASGSSGCQAGGFKVSLEQVGRDLASCEDSLEILALAPSEISVSARTLLRRNCL